MTVFSYGQLEQLWIDAGGPTNLAPVAAAVALAESGGNSSSTNPTDNNGKQTSWGLWQISDGTHNQPVANILDPVVNAQAAVAKYNASGWEPWGTHDTGAYLKFLQTNVPPNPSGVPTSPGQTATGQGVSANLTSSSGAGSQGGTATALPGIGGFLQQLDKAMNPGGVSGWQEITSLGTAGIGQTLEMILVRAGLTLGFGLVIYFGLKQITGGGGTTNVIQITQGAVRTQQAGRRASTAERAQDLRERQQAEGLPIRRQERVSSITYRNAAAETREARLAATVARKNAAGRAASFVEDAL